MIKIPCGEMGSFRCAQFKELTGFTPNQHNTLCIIAINSKKGLQIRQAQVQKEFPHLTIPYISKITRWLKCSGYIVCKSCCQDKRQRWYEITEKGVQQLHINSFQLSLILERRSTTIKK